jgi:hypothetical protein
VPGYGNGTVCVAADTPSAVPGDFKGDDSSSVFDKRLINHCVRFQRDLNVFLLCYRQNSTLNSRSLGTFSHFERIGNSLYSVGGPGAPYRNGASSLNVSLECDQTISKSAFMIPSFTLDKAKCAVKSVLLSRGACKIRWLNPSKKEVHEIRCIPKAVHDATIATLP